MGATHWIAGENEAANETHLQPNDRLPFKTPPKYWSPWGHLLIAVDLYRTYGPWGLMRLTLDYLHTRLRMPRARLLRRPAFLRGRRWMIIGSGLTTGTGLRLDAFPRDKTGGPVLRIGQDVQLNDHVHIAAVSSVTIGDRVLIASRVFIADHHHGRYSGDGPHDSPLVPPAERPLSCAAVVIEEDVWVGEGVCVLPGVRIGRGSVIGAGSVVTREVPAYCVAVGVPARIIRRFNHETLLWEAN